MHVEKDPQLLDLNFEAVAVEPTGMHHEVE